MSAEITSTKSAFGSIGNCDWQNGKKFSFAHLKVKMKIKLKQVNFLIYLHQLLIKVTNM